MKSLTVFSDLSNFENAQRMAKALTSSTLVPEHFRGDNNMGNALIGLELAQRMDMSPMAVLQSLYVVHGRPAFSAQFLIACFNASGRFSPIVYEQVGKQGTPSFGYRAISSVLSTGQAIHGPEVTMAIADKDGWSKRNPKYQSMPDLMLRYRAATWMIRTVAPEIGMGLQTVEEVQDVPVERNITPTASVETLNASLGAQSQKPEQYVPPVPRETKEPEPPIQEEPEQPAQGPEELDSEGLPWVEHFHSSTKSQTQDGRWRVRRGVDEAAYKAWRADNRKKQSQDLIDETAEDSIPQKSIAGESPVANLMEVWNPKIRACKTLAELDAVEEELAQAIKESEPGHEVLSLIDTTLEWTRRQLGGNAEEDAPF